MVYTDCFKVAQQNIEIERLYSRLEESEEKSRSEIEKLKHDHEVEASWTTSEVCIRMPQIYVWLKLIMYQNRWQNMRQKIGDYRQLCKLPLLMLPGMPS